MRGLTALDLRENISALAIAIIRNDIDSSEIAFKVLEKGRRSNRNTFTNEEIFKMFESGVSAKEISRTTGLAVASVYSYISRYRKTLQASQVY